MSTAIERLADGLRAEPGAYTILIGAGCSMPAGIADGQSLLAPATQGHAPGSRQSLVEIYVERYGRWPSYETLLMAEAGITPAPSATRAEDRAGADGAEFESALSRLFEPTAAERATGVKVPARAHWALSKLARSSHVRVILTTNFDRLIETALRAAGLRVRVAATPDAFAHVPLPPPGAVNVIKLHGDWRAIRPKTLPREQAAYAFRSITELLREVFARHHVIVCGWSGEWDVALRSALLAAPADRRLYWTAVGEPGSIARAVIAARGGMLIHIDSADAFLSELAANVLRL
jgi:hypothetical protein